MSTVVGTGIPGVDVPAVQAAVNLGGDVILERNFSFNTSPTIPTAPPLSGAGYPKATILVSEAVTISGAKNASIEGGSIPFYVEAPGASVTIQGLRFIKPAARAVVVYAANGLTIANCKIEGVVPVPRRAAPQSTSTRQALYLLSQIQASPRTFSGGCWFLITKLTFLEERPQTPR